MSVQGMPYAEFKHMFELGYINKEKDPEVYMEIIRDLMDYVVYEDTALEIELASVEDKLENSQKETERLQQDYNKLRDQNDLLREHHRITVNHINELKTMSDKMLQERVEARSY